MDSPILCLSKECTGCGACKSSCPTACISMQPDKQGFLEPHIDLSCCNQCGKCERSCPVLKLPNVNPSENPTVYACWHVDDDVRMRSSSGGAFSAFAEAILDDGGIVYGAAYNERLRVHHISVEDISGLDKLRGSKYVQSEIGETFKEIKCHLGKGRRVLFVGTPCQVAGLHSFLGKSYSNLLTADLICHGVPSPLVFKKYIGSLEQRYKTVFRSINFRDKRHGWENNSVIAVSRDNKEYHLKGHYNSFFNGFILNTFLRESCYQCPFTGLPRSGDITLADYWGIKQSAQITQTEVDKGISLLIINNPQQSSRIINLINGRLMMEERSFEEAKTGNSPMFTPAPQPPDRDAFFADLNKLDYDSLVKRYLTPSVKKKAVQFLKENLPVSALTFLRKVKKFKGLWFCYVLQ